MLAGLDVRLPLETTLEQATYFAPERPGNFAPHHLPLWIWMDDPSYYGFPCYGEPTVKAAQDCGGPVIDTSDPLLRTSDPDPAMQERLAAFMASLLPESGQPVRSIRCQYTLTPDRDFVLAPVPGHESVVVGLGAAHGFKFAPTFGRVLADLATSGSRPRRPHAVPPRPAGAHRPVVRRALAGVTSPSPPFTAARTADTGPSPGAGRRPRPAATSGRRRPRSRTATAGSAR